jgi:hypothetical protein
MVRSRKAQWRISWGIIFFLLIFSPVLVCSSVTYGDAADADALAKQAGKLLRDAENKMFNGKNEEALQVLSEAETILNVL